MVTDTTEPFASVTVVVTEPSALVALEVVSADEDEEEDDEDDDEGDADDAALGALAGCGALIAAGILVVEPMVISLPLSLTEASVAPTDEAMINTARPSLNSRPAATAR